MIDIRATLTKQIAFATGVVLHLAVFRIGEWDMATTSLINTFALVPLVATALLSRVFPDVYPSLLQTATAAATLEGFLILGVYTSMMIYRGWFHRLRKFPGPFLARFSNLYITALSAKNLHLYDEVQLLHQKYGDFVRVGKHHDEAKFKNMDCLLTERAQDLRRSLSMTLEPSPCSRTTPRKVHGTMSSSLASPST